MKNYYFGIDIGGTDIKGGIIDENNNILCRCKVPTSVSKEQDYLPKSIMKLVEKLELESGLKLENASGMGFGVPGLIDPVNGIVRFSGNLNLRDYPLKEKLQMCTNVPIKISNDADVATLAELKFGAGKPYQNFIMLTLGTGIGSGIVINGQLLRNNSPYSCEVGHMKILDKGLTCGCGETDCYETLASTKALVGQIKAAMQNNPKSAMWKTYTLDSVNAQTVFDYLKTDKTAKEVFENYITYLGTGIVSLVNVFLPDVIVLGGWLSTQKDLLTKPLEKFVNSHIHTKNIGTKIKIITAEATSNAGLLGGKCLFD